MVSPGEKNYKYLIGYKDDDHTIKPLCIMPPKTSPYIKSYNGKTKWMYFLLKLMNYYKNIIVFQGKNLTANPFTIKNF